MRTLERLVAEKGIASRDTLARYRAAWDRAADRTPHGTPIKLSLGCDVSRAGNGMSSMRVLRFASAARAGSVSRPSSIWRPTKCVWMFGRRVSGPKSRDPITYNANN